MKLIDAEFLKNRIDLMADGNCTLGERAIISLIKRAIDNSPDEVDPVRDKGVWIIKRNNGNIRYRECSICHKTTISDIARYCHYCGSRNDKEVETSE